MASPESKAVRQFLLNHKKAQSGKPFSVEETRRELEAMFGNRPVDPDVRIEKVTIGGIPAEWMSAPNAEGKCAFLYLHGGGVLPGKLQHAPGYGGHAFTSYGSPRSAH